MTKKKEFKWLALAALIPLTAYLWGLWYYGGLYQSGQLFPTSKVTLDTLFRTLIPNIVVLLPEFLAGFAALACLGQKRFMEEMGLCVRTRRKPALLLVAGACLLALAAAFLFIGSEPLTVGYQWVYY